MRPLADPDRAQLPHPNRGARHRRTLPAAEHAFWALALYAGLRRGELRALQVSDIDFEAGLVRVRRGWDDVEGEIDPKTFAGARDIPIMGELRRICRSHKLATSRHGTQLSWDGPPPSRSTPRPSGPAR